MIEPCGLPEGSRGAVIFDIDGTLADCDHRRHHVMKAPKDWKSFEAEADLDQPKPEIVRLTHIFSGSYAILLCTGRYERRRESTRAWLHRHGIPHYRLYMRVDGDSRNDAIVKGEMLDRILAEGFEP